MSLRSFNQIFIERDTSQKHLKRDVFFVTSLRRLKYVSKKMSFCDVFKTSQIHLKNIFILSKISLESICDYSKIFHKSGFVSLRIFLDNLFVGKETSVPLASIGQGIMQ